MSDLAIELFGVTKRFGPKVAVNAVSFSVPRGSVFGLIGPNGAGKTTTFSMMCGYLYPSEGSLKVMDVDPATPGALKGRLGALPQDAVLPPGWETGALLTYWARLSNLAEPEREAREALEQVGLMEAWNVQTQALSHGMAKRAAMAQSLMGKPPLVLLDEPTAGLDPRIAAQVRQVIKAMKDAGQTVVVSSHNLQELEELCDAAAILDKGTLAQAGTMSELTGQGSEFRVQIARGDVLIPEITALADVTDARMESEHVLRVRIRGGVRPEEVISRVVGHLLQHGVLILGVSRGQRLEDRVLQLL
ncbi:ABC transporter ATP-binding protein [Pyxidicoccus parkwayensis]|uniref:ABC transporter ATP-binding protein n=1 Tax=Pyxidicoccus parkwayensis TaxID=2813578 RepID=A0ABX7P9C5_9BACT|nr:ABC transporter ATP-binding protein [Pyxidicoccus parkwaysis]QSQ27028.1 ABC transporter ATP-binding protein [Pyxidicoccus parkwaysis]